jgi:hypothetical protein
VSNSTGGFSASRKAGRRRRVVVTVSAARLRHAAGGSRALARGGAGVSRRIAASTATAAGSSIRSGSPCRARERRASSAPALRIAARPSASSLAGQASRHRCPVTLGDLCLCTCTVHVAAMRADAREAVHVHNSSLLLIVTFRGGESPVSAYGLDDDSGRGEFV